MKIVDSHVHLDLIDRYHPGRIAWLMDHDVHVVSWAYFAGIDSVTTLERRMSAMAHRFRQLSEAGLACHFLVGIHPRSIPPDLQPGGIRPLLAPYLQDPLCRGLGEIGLETGSDREQRVFIEQLELGWEAASKGRVIGVHTPRTNKTAITGVSLGILDAFAGLRPSLVVDHCTPETLPAVLDAGYRAGVTLSPDKTSWEEMKRMAGAHRQRLDRIMCNTDSGSLFFEDAVRCSRSNDLPEKVLKQLFDESARDFFSL